MEEKIQASEGLIKIRETGEIMTANEHNRLTDKLTNPESYELWQSYNVDPYSKNDMKIENDELVLKTFVDRIIDIRKSALDKIDEMSKKVKEKEDQKTRLQAIQCWDDGQEAELNDLRVDLNLAINDFKNSQIKFMTCINETDFENVKTELLPIFQKYNIKV